MIALACGLLLLGCGCVALFAWALCRMAALSDAHSEHEILLAPYGPPGAEPAAALVDADAELVDMVARGNKVLANPEQLSAVLAAWRTDVVIDDATQQMPAVTPDEVDARFEEIKRQLWPERRS